MVIFSYIFCKIGFHFLILALNCECDLVCLKYNGQFSQDFGPKQLKISSLLRVVLIVPIIKLVRFRSLNLFSSFKENIYLIKVGAIPFNMLNISNERKGMFCLCIQTEPSFSSGS